MTSPQFGFKMQYTISYADAFAADTAEALGTTLVSGDLELVQLEIKVAIERLERRVQAPSRAVPCLPTAQISCDELLPLAQAFQDAHDHPGDHELQADQHEHGAAHQVEPQTANWPAG